jgi:DNA replication and repair protein RecF
MVPLFLLDDIAAHLDDRRRAALFDEILSLRCQAWLTGTDRDSFAALMPSAQVFQVENGIITRH